MEGRTSRGLIAAAVRACLLFASAALPAAARGDAVLFDFETDRDRAAVSRGHDGEYTVEITNAWATSGYSALLFACPPWINGMYDWPSFTLLTPFRDWRGYDRMVVDVVNFGDRGAGDLIGIYVAGPDGRIQNGLEAQFRLTTALHAQLIVSLGKWPEGTSSADISRIHFFTERPHGFSVAIDRIALLKPGEEPRPPEGPCIGRDMMSLLDAERTDLRRRVAELEEQIVSMEGYLRFREACSKAGLRSPDMLIGTATSMDKICPRRATAAARPVPRNGLFVRLARNEYESFQILVAPRDFDLKDVSVAVEGDFKSEGNDSGTVFKAADISVSPVGYVRTRITPPYMIGRNASTNVAPGYVRLVEKPHPGWHPDPILPFLGSVDVKGRDVQSFWVRFHCPQGQRAGTYRGAVAVSARGVAPVRVPVTVRVNNFTLGRTSRLPLAVTYDPYTCDPSRPSPAADAARARRPEWTAFLADYLLPTDSIYHHSELERLDALALLKREGRSAAVYNLGYWRCPREVDSLDDWRKETIPRLASYRDAAKTLGLDGQAYAYGCDELMPETFPMMRKAVAELKAALPGVAISTTARDRDYGVGTPLDGIDWFTPLSMDYDPAKAEASRRAGHKVWWYICCWPQAPYANMFVESPAIETRRLMGAQAVKMRPDGFLYYQISIWNQNGCITSGPFTEWDPRSYETYHGDGSWTCAGPDGTPLATIRLENFRDGLEDYAYAMKLEETAGDYETARKLLAVPRKVVDTMSNYTDNPAVLYRWRDAMADLIEAHGGDAAR